MTELTRDIIAFVIGYGFGSIPFGLLLTRLAGLGDVRKIGSGNIGATNVLRTGNKGLAAATVILDIAKGYVPIAIAWYWLGQPDALPEAYFGPVPMAGAGAVLGHCFPVWLGFKGGKGVATNAGVCFGLAWPIGLVYASVWLLVLAVSRISSLAGISAVVAAALYAMLAGYEAFAPLLLGTAILVIWLHRANIGRLIAGNEPRIGKGR